MPVIACCRPQKAGSRRRFQALAQHFLGIDIGGSKVACALGDEQGRVLARRRRPVESRVSARDEVGRISSDLHALMDEVGASSDSLRRIGVSAPGPLDSRRGLILGPPNLPGWDEVPIASWLAEEFGCEVALENDANAAAFAEWRAEVQSGVQAQSGRGARDLVLLTMSTGVGAGLVLDGRIHRGRCDLAGEIGHAPVVWEGLPCTCGLRGCLEAYVGGAAWSRRLQRGAAGDDRVAQLAGGRDAARPEHVVLAAREGDAFALSELERFNEMLARAIVSLAFTLAPDVVVLGTIATAAGEDLCLAPLRRKVREHTWPRLARGLVIRGLSLGDELPYAAGLGVALSAEPEA